MTQEPKKPTVADVDPSVMAVDATPDEVRTHGDLDETDTVQAGDGSLLSVDQMESTPDQGEVGPDNQPDDPTEETKESDGGPAA